MKESQKAKFNELEGKTISAIKRLKKNNDSEKVDFAEIINRSI